MEMKEKTKDGSINKIGKPLKLQGLSGFGIRLARSLLLIKLNHICDGNV